MIRVLRESKTTPKNLQVRVARAGGRNLLGEPNFRLVWGWSRLTWIGGKWEDWDSHGAKLREVVELRQEPKYTPFDRWHIESWLPPSYYGTPGDWEELTTEVVNGTNVPALGPYPSRGEWEHCFTLQGPKGEFLNPDHSDIAELLVGAVARSKYLTLADRKRSIRDREEKSAQEVDGEADDLLDDAMPAFHGLSKIVVPNLETTLEINESRRIQ